MPKPPRRFHKLTKEQKKHLKFCPWCGTCWRDRAFCNRYCESRFKEFES